MARDITAGVQTSNPSPSDVAASASAAVCVASHAHHADDARLLLDVLGLSEAAPIARALLRMNRKEETR